MRPVSRGRSRARSTNRTRRPRSSKRSGQRSRSRSSSPIKKLTNAIDSDFLFEVGTLGSGMQSMSLTRQGSARHSDRTLQHSHRDFTSESFNRMVRDTFYDNPATYRKFVQILSEVEYGHIDKLDLIKRVITLFDGYPHLIEGFNTFLPAGYCIQIQDDAVVIKVFESSGMNTHHIDTGHFRNYGDGDVSTGQSSSDQCADDTLTYVHRVKEMCADKPEKYNKFTAVLKDFHSKKVDEVETIHRIVSLFHNYPHLVTGFNAFLPQGFHVYIYEQGYDVEYPGTNDGETTIVRFRKK